MTTVTVDADHLAPVSERVWRVPLHSRLQDVLYRWAALAGWTLVWNTEYGYDLQAAAAFEGDFVKATRAMLDAVGKVDPPIYVRFYLRNKVLVVNATPDS